MMLSQSRRFAVAPMLDWTDRHARYFYRLLSPHTLLFTEMVTTGALIYGDRERYLAHDAVEYPLALQLGGSDPADLARCVQMAKAAGYSEANLNIGCPSDRVQSGRFGACLMLEPSLVAECVTAMCEASDLPVSVKCRIGIDDQDEQQGLRDFIEQVAASGCRFFTIHARKAWLQGLSPRENRDIPPLNYELVYAIKRENPGLHIAINGGIETIAACKEHLNHVDGVMVGRHVYHHPYFLQQVEQQLFGNAPRFLSRKAVLERFYPYVEAQLNQGVYLGNITRHLLGLFHGLPGARKFRRYISENAHKKAAGLEVLQQAAALVKEETVAEDSA